MQLSNRTYIIILIAVIIGLSLTSYFRFQRIKEADFEISFPKIEMPEMNLDKLMFAEKEGYEEWISPDEKLKIKYPASWTPMNEALLAYSKGEGILLQESEILFFAHRFKIDGQIFALLTISEFSAEKGLEEILEETEENVKGGGGDIEITILETDDVFVELEIFSGYPNQSTSYSKGGIIFNKEKTYLILFSSFQKDWHHFEKETKEIFDSIQLLQ